MVDVESNVDTTVHILLVDLFIDILLFSVLDLDCSHAA